ncbi:unnamed protein product [Camellia sinensis]
MDNKQRFLLSISEQMWIFGRKGPSGFSANSTAEEVTKGIDGTGLTAIVTVFVAKVGGSLNSVHLMAIGGLIWSSMGASSGIGTETARVLAMHGVHVVMAVRNTDAGRKVKDAILKENPNAKIDVMELDLSSMVSVRKFASEYKSTDLPLNLLMVMAPPFMLTQDKIELQFGTNHIGHFLLTNLLLETMKNTARVSHKEGRIVNVSSEGHRFAYSEGVRFDKINDESRGGFNTIYAYGQSKLANILHANELARRLKEEGVEITANSLHPGAIATNLLRHHGFLDGLVNLVGKYVLKNTAQGAATTCYVALHPQVKGVTGEYFSDSNIAKPTAQAKDADLAKKLWDFSLSLTDPK